MGSITTHYKQGKRGRWRWHDEHENLRVAQGPVSGYKTEQEAQNARHAYGQKIKELETEAVKQLQQRLQEAKGLVSTLEMRGKDLLSRATRAERDLVHSNRWAWFVLAGGLVVGGRLDRLGGHLVLMLPWRFPALILVLVFWWLLALPLSAASLSDADRKAQLQQIFNELSTGLTELSTRLQQQQQTTSEQQQQISELQSLLEKLKAQLKQSQTELSESQKARAAQQSSLETLTASLKVSSDSLQKAQQSVAALESERTLWQIATGVAAAVAVIGWIHQ